MGEELEARFSEAAAQERARRNSGRVTLYMSADFHQRFRAFCEDRGVSMNKAALIAIKTIMERFGE